MNNNYLMGIDIGGSGGRCLLINSESKEIVSSKRFWEHIPIANSIGYYDLDTKLIWSCLKDCIRETVKKANIEPTQICGIAVSSVRYGLVCIDKNKNVLFAVPNTDGRAAMTGAELGATRGEEFFQKTGHWPGAVLPGVRLKNIADESPELLQKIDSFLSISDWFNFLLTKKIATDISHASGSMLFDIYKQEWSNDLIDSLGLPKHIFPEIKNCGARLGTLESNIADELGLTVGTPVMMAGADTQMSLLGAGLTKPNQIAIVAGSTAPIQCIIKNATPTSNANHLWREFYPLQGFSVLESNVGPVGTTLDFMADCLYHGYQENTAMLCAEARLAHVGSGGIVSSMGTSLFNAKEMDVPLGHLTVAPVLYQKQMSKKPHVARAILEGIAYGISANIQQITDVLQNPIDLYLTGGISHSSLLPQIISDINNIPIKVPDTTLTTALGAAICAGVGEKFASLEEGVTKLVGQQKKYTPNSDRHFTYKSLFEEWFRLNIENKNSNKIAAEMILQAASESNIESIEKQENTFRPKIYVSAHMDEKSLLELRKLGDVTYVSYRDEMLLLTGDVLVETLQGYHVFICEVDVLDGESLEQLKDLRVVFSCRGNAVNIDTESCTTLGLPVMNAPGRNAVAVADITVSFMLMLARKLQQATTFLHAADVEAGDMARMGMAHKQLQGNELWHKKVGLIGMGAVGREVIKRLLPFAVEIFVYDPYLSEEDIVITGAKSISLEELLVESDFISLHAAVTAETRNLIGKNELQKMKPGCFLVNTARAALVDEEALLASLQQNHLGGVALDVFSVEPPGANHPLLAFPNVIATPHVAGNTFEVSEHQGEIVVAELNRLLKLEKPRYMLNPQTFEGFSWQGSHKKLSKKEKEKLLNSNVSITDLEVEAQKTSTKPKQGMFSKIRNIVTHKKEKVESPMLVEKSNTQSQIAQLEKILRLFLNKASQDNALKLFSTKQDTLVHYIIPDTEQHFSFYYNKGNIITEWGKPKNKPDVTLKMKAEILDGVLTGKINGVRAAMTGKLSFSGDTVKAIKLKKIDKDTIRLYSICRKEIGDPGDLSNLSPQEENQQQANVQANHNTSKSPAILSPVAHQITTGDERDEVVQIFNELYAAKLITSTGGNVSVRIPQKPEHVWITPSQVYKGGLNGNMIVSVDLDGNQLDNENYNASSERHLHTMIMKKRPQINAVIHSHAPQATILALSELPFLPISTEAAFVGEIPRVPFIMPGSKELAKAVAEAMAEGTAVLMQNHGLVVAAASLRQAADITMIIEQTAEKIIACYAVNKKPQVLDPDTVEMLRGLGDMII